MAELIGDIDAERVRANLAAVRDEIASRCGKSGRDPSGVELLAATKYVPLESMAALADAGITLVGENTAQSLKAKHERFADRFTFDFIGHLQSRKTKDVLPLIRLIHSVSSESVLSRIERHAERPVEALLEVNISEEPSKQGVLAGDLDSFLELAAGFERTSFAGLMTMPPASGDPEAARPWFAALRRLAERLRRDWAPRHRFEILSMGTSQDFGVAVEEGATIVRLGSVLYR